MNNAAVFIQSTTSIGFIIPDIVLENIGTDRTVVTENPIEVGTPSCDHAYRRPAEILMRVGWSNSTHQQEGYVQQIYAALIALKNSYQLIDVMTAKRSYSNMLIESCILRDDVTTPFAAMCTVNCKEILITSGTAASNTTTTPGSSTGPTPADPSNTGAVGDVATEAGISQGVGDYSAAQFAQVGGLTNTTTPALGSNPIGTAIGTTVPTSGYPDNVLMAVTPASTPWIVYDSGSIMPSTAPNQPLTSIYIPTGLKVGEITGGGTGVPTYYDPTSAQWLTYSSDAPVAQ